MLHIFNGPLTRTDTCYNKLYQSLYAHNIMEAASPMQCFPKGNEIVHSRKQDYMFKVIGLNTGIFWLFRTCSVSFDHLIGEKTRMYFAKSLSDSIMNSYSLLPNITILIKQSTSMALQRI